jgi:diaminopimelate decarboxylase
MLYGSQHHIDNISNPKGKERFYSVVGYICETDTLQTTEGFQKLKKEIY